MSYLEKLKTADDRKQLANILGFKPSSLSSIVYMTPPEDKYAVFEIPKKNGGLRTIKAPNEKLKKLQLHLAHVLYQCLSEIDGQREASPVSFGFRKDSSIADNARTHKRSRYILNLDLADFFPSFNFGRVRGFFLKDKAFELKPEVATTIAQIACDGEALPQGSPCSPVISELIAQILDVRLLRFAKKHGVRYSRYADDITFSTNQKAFPAALAIQDDENVAVWTLGADLISKIEGSGFKINDEKTRMHCRGSRQMVTGLVVNDKVNIASEYYRRARAMCDALFQTGQYYKSMHPPEKEGDEPKPEFINNLNPLEGILSFIYSITQNEEQRSVQDQRQKPRAIRELYRRFLFYKHCVALQKPLVITEGKTDAVYLRAAIKRRTQFHPKLGQLNQDSFEFAVRFFSYGREIGHRGKQPQPASEIMDLGGGTGDLRSVLMDYLYNIDGKNDRKPFKHKPMQHPVILVLDNDSGLKDVAALIKKNFGIAISTKTTDPFYRIRDNIYLVKTPEGASESCIEDLFPKKWLKRKLNGKTFNPQNKIDIATEYSKEVFAKSVVLPNADQIDFKGFDLLLDRIAKVLDDYVA